MLINALRKPIGFTRQNTLQKSLNKFYGIYEPDYLKLQKSKYPQYPPLVIQIRGYDYPIIENYQKWVAKVIKIMDFKIMESIPMPSKDTLIKRLKPRTKETYWEYYLKMYERNLKISEVTSIGLPILIRTLEAGLPEGVLLDIKSFSSKDMKRRYVPNKQLLELKEQYKKG